MKNIFFASLFISTFCFAQKNDSVMLRKIASEVLQNGECYRNLEYLCTKIGGRLSGSPQAAAAVDYTYNVMKAMKLDTVYVQECMVPHWVRGEKESGKIMMKAAADLDVPICALGGSIATPKEGLTAEVVEVKSFDELKKLGKAGVQGKIVFYNHAFDETFVNNGAAYGEAVVYRWKGPSEAARYGAIGSITRSMTSALDDYPHTGSMRYNDSLPKIPCCAISTKAANLLSMALKKNTPLKFYMKLNCQTLPDVKSFNVIGEIRGSEHPEEIITVGGHLDSWELGQGAHDDGTGATQSMEVLRALKALGYKPKRTIRAVMFMNEENGTRGAQKYFDNAKAKKEKHVLAIETDAGGFTPTGFGLSMTTEQKAKVQGWKPLFTEYGVWNFEDEGGGADIGPLKELGCALMGLHVDGQRYFDYHHTAADSFDKVNRREQSLGAAVMAMMVYLVSEHGL